MTITDAPSRTLTNGLRVANFSSPHPFNFVDGSVLPACDNDRCLALSMDRDDEVSAWPGKFVGVNAPVYQVKPVFVLNAATIDELEVLQESWDVDVVIVPFPLLTALQSKDLLERFNQVATVIMADRLTKAAHIDKFGR